MPQDNAEIARQWAQGLSGDLTRLAALMAPSARIWHSHDGEWLTLAESTARMAQGQSERATATAAFGEVRAQATGTGVLVQATLRSDARGPRPTHIVQVLTVDQGKVVRVEEYIAPQSEPA